MSGSESRVDMIKPFLIKAGILSVGAYVFARCISSKRPDSKIDTQTHRNRRKNEVMEVSESFHSLNSSSFDGVPEGLEVGCTSNNNLEDKLHELESLVQDLQAKELDTKSRYLRYRALKDRELMLTELKNEMLLEKTRAEFLVKEICIAEEELKRVGNLVVNFVRLFNEFQALRKENVMLQRKARKLCRRGEHRMMIIRKQRIEIESKAEELMRNWEAIEGKDGVVQEIEDENKGLKEVIDHLQREKIELLVVNNKVDHSSSLLEDTKVEITESVSKEEYDKIIQELEQVQKDKENDANQITYLKWSNACLRQELLRHQLHNKDDHDHDDHKRLIEFFDDDEHQGHENGNTNDNNIATSKRRRFITKIKKWVDGGHGHHNTYEKEKSESKCFGQQSVPQEAENHRYFVNARVSCSSV